jgi:hypothetical protein
MSCTNRTGVLTLILAGTAMAAGSKPNLHLTCNRGELSATLPAGNAVWKIRLADEGSISLTAWNGESGLLSNGLAFDRLGRVLGRWPGPAADGDGLGAAGAGGWPEPAWDSLFEIAPPPPPGEHDASTQPLFDSGGNAWIILTHYAPTENQLQVRKSDGHSGAWGLVQTIYSTSNNLMGVEWVIDQNDNITVVFRELSGGYKLCAQRYVPAEGWGSVQQLYSSSTFFQVVEAGIDQAGDVAVVFDYANTLASIVRDAATGTWGPLQYPAPPGSTSLLPSVLYNTTSDSMCLVYLVTVGGPVGLYANTFNSATRSWGPATLLPGTGTASYEMVGAVSRYPGVVDAAGEATIFWGDPNLPHASRTVGGTWQTAVQLATFEVVDPPNLANAAVSPACDVLGLFSQFDSGLVRFCAFRYEAGVGWQPAERPHAFALPYAAHIAARFYQGRRVAVAMSGLQEGVRQLASFLFDGTTWQPGLLDIPGTYEAPLVDSASDRGETLLVFDASTITSRLGLWATWLRAPNPGDMNCDLLVDAFDIDPFVAALTDAEAYAAAYPECYRLNADCNYDGAVNAFDIDPFVELLVGN